MKKQLILLVLLFSFLSGTTLADNVDYGLYIKAFPFSDHEKTSLVLENNQPLTLNKETTMSFEMSVRKENVFGVVFRMITNKKENIDFLFTVGENDKRYPMLVINESVYMINQEVVCDKWVPISITLSSLKNEVTLNYGAAKISVPYKVSQADNVMVSFGLCPFNGHTLYDLASVNVRNIKIFDGQNLTRFWKLENHDQSKTLDSITRIPAITTNPLWLTDAYASWEKIYSKPVKENALFSFNSEQGIIYIVSPDSKEVVSFDTGQRKEKVIHVKSGIIAANAPNQIFYDSHKHRLISYNLEENIISRFSFVDESWDSHVKPLLEHGYWNNSVSFSSSDSTLISFGGYGFYKYNNDLIRLDVDRKSIKKSNLPEIPPRYSASTIIINNVLYVFGGRGNKSGRQELSPRNFYDFYAVNLLTEQTNKLWELTGVENEFIPSENMIFDEKENCFYVFTTRDGGILLRLRKDKNTLDQVSYPIHEDLTSHYLYTNLYYSPAQKKLYALINKIRTDKSAEVIIYSLNYPPVTIDVINSNGNLISKTDSSSAKVGILFIVLIVFILILLAYYLLRKKQSKNKKVYREMNNGKEKLIDEVFLQDRIENKNREIEVSYYNFSKSSICFLGGFSVMDKDGQDITNQFTPMLKYLLVLLILSTEKDSKGISGKKLIQLLWYDKNEESAKNNRNVYLSKLRSVLENVGNAEILNQNGSWTINLNNVVCDYVEAMRIFSAIKEDRISSHGIDHLLELLLRGVLLPNTEADWVDGFKSDFSNMTIDILTGLSQGNYNNKQTDDIKLKIADTLFLHDFINEEALYLKCSIFFNSGKKGIAKTIYDSFNKEYFNLLGIKYKYSLTDVIDRKNIEH